MAQAPNPTRARVPERRGGRRREAAWGLALTLALWACLGSARLAGDHFGYDKWDNFEYHTPTVREAHRQWLAGRIPVWNHHQHMGEPLLANAQPSVLYAPYTALLLAMGLAGSPPGSFCLWVAALHLPWMGWGVYRLLRALGARPEAAGLGALGASTSGALTATSAVWIFVCPIFAWLPWALLGCLGALRDPRSGRGLALAALSLAMINFVCHPQYLVYAWLFVGLFAAAAALWIARGAGRLLRLLLAALAALLLSAPALLPVLEVLPFTARSAFSEKAFLANSIEPVALLGLLAPVSNLGAGFFFNASTLLFHQGAWVVPALVLAALSPLAARGPEGSRERADDLLAPCAIFAALGALFTCFSLGPHGGLYPLSYGLPVWSSFRWPHKFAAFGVFGIGLAAALGLELALRGAGRIPSAARPALAGALLALFGLPWLAGGAPAVGSAGGALSLASGAVAIAALLWSHTRAGRAGLLASGVAGAAGLAILVHDVNLKDYAEPYASLGAAQLGIDPAYRVLPLSPHAHAWDSDEPSAMQEYGIYQMATANGYASLTGFITSLAPSWYRQVIGSDGFGLIPRPRYGEMLRSHLLLGLNVRYLIAAKRDRALLQELRAMPGLAPLRELSETVIFENPAALPRAWFAESARPFEARAFEAGLLRNGAPPRTAFAEGLAEAGPRPRGRVRAMRWGDGGRVDLEVEAPEGGFLVVAQTWFPQWQARVDGRPVPLLRTNGAVQGLELPPGAGRVELRWSSPALRRGCALAAAGVLLLVACARSAGARAGRSPAGRAR